MAQVNHFLDAPRTPLVHDDVGATRTRIWHKQRLAVPPMNKSVFYHFPTRLEYVILIGYYHYFGDTKNGS